MNTALHKVDPRYQNPWKIGMIVLLAGVAAACAQHKVPTILLDLQTMFSLDAAAGSWLMSILALIGVFFALPVGKLIQNRGFKPLMIAGLGIIVLGSLIGILAGALLFAPALFVSRAIEGIGMMIVSTCGATAVTQCVTPKRQGLAMGLWSNWGAIGGAVGMVATPFIWISVGFTWVWSIFIAVAVVAAALMVLFIKDPQQALIAAAIESGMDLAVGPPGRYREVITRDTLLVLYAFVCFSLGLLALLSYLPTILQMQGVPQEYSAFPITLIQLLSLIFVPLFGAISDKTGRSKPLLVGTFFFFGLGIFLMFTNTGWVLWTTATLQGMLGFTCIGLFLVAWSKVLPRPELMPIGMGVFVLVQSLGQFLGSSVAQMLLGPDLANWFFAGAVLFVIITSGAVALFFARFK